MFSHVSSPPFPPAPASFNLAAYVLAAASTTPDKTALQIIDPDAPRSWSFGALRDAVASTASGLRAMGLNRADRVLMRLGNTEDFPIVYLGAIWAGLVPVPTSSALTQAEISTIAAQVEPALIVADPGVPLPETYRCPVVTAAGLRDTNTLVEAETGDPERPAYIIFTSGTSGRARGVVHAHRAIWARQMMWRGWYDLRADDRLLHAGAFNWTYTLGTGLMDPWAAGATALIPAPGTAATGLPGLLAKHKVSLFAAAPGVYRQMLRCDPFPALPTLRHGLSAGEKLPEALRARWQAQTGTTIHEALGMSECSTFISGCPAHPAPQGTSGQPQPGRRIAVLDDEGQPVARNTPGVLGVHKTDPGLMLGYLNAGDCMSGDWFVTGDTVSMDDHDAVTYLGRADDMMNAGGFRVSPLEVEAAMLTHPALIEAAAVEDEIAADTRVIRLFYVATHPVADQDLHDHAAALLARYKCPRIFTLCDSLPKSGNGKINRRALRR
jgi:acyl-coenzyme A synthetase/AMP-(fatty) acid ligase